MAEHCQCAKGAFQEG